MIQSSSAESSYESKVEAQKKLVAELKVEWKLLWSERFNDKEKAEGVSANDYKVLHVERGLVIHATRNFKALNFQEILEKQKIENPERFIQPDIRIGGWNKFIKNEIAPQSSQQSKRVASYLDEKRSIKHEASQLPKKGGRGWLHKI